MGADGYPFAPARLDDDEELAADALMRLYDATATHPHACVEGSAVWRARREAAEVLGSLGYLAKEQNT